MAKSFFKRLESITGIEMPDASNLSIDERAEVVFQLRTSGEKISHIAEYIGKSRPTVYADIERAKENRLMGLENSNAISIFTETLMQLEVTRDFHRRRVSEINKIINHGWCHKKDDDGNKIPKTALLRDLSEASRLVAVYDKMVTELLQRTGLIPTAPTSTNVNIYGSVKDRDPTNNIEDNSLQEKNSSQLMQILLAKLQNKPQELNGLKGLITLEN